MKKYYNTKFYDHKNEMVSDCPDYCESISCARKMAIGALRAEMKYFYAEITVQKRMSKPIIDDVPPDIPIIRIEILEDGSVSETKII